MTLAGGSRSSAAVAEAERFLGVPLESAFVYSKEAFFDREGRQRRALWCREAEEKVNFWLDTEKEAKAKGDFLRAVMRVLRPADPLPPAPRRSCLPRIFIETNADVLCVTETRDVEAAPPDALWNPMFVALVRGVRSGGRLFWESYGGYRYGGFIDAASGRIFSSRKQIPEMQRFVVALMRADGPVLRCKANFNLRVWRRSGLRLELHRGRVRSTGRTVPHDADCWTDPLVSDDFQEHFRVEANR